MTAIEESTQSYAIVLAGGRSSRMGTAKAVLPIGATTVLDRIVSELRRLFASILVVAAPAAEEPFNLSTAGVTIVRDEVAFAGPVRALAAALAGGPGDRAFVCSCDVPLIKSSVVAALIAMLDQHDAVIPVVGGKPQMMHAVYRRQCADALRDMEARGTRRLTALAEIVDSRIVGEEELRALDPKLESFFNLNTPSDYRRLLKILRIGATG